ncbi:MAG: exo-alpha-sialidase [Nitrospira sp. CG24A]|nr:MAG: exo-alpha-sialidase [Nitrospira sp. CG24A]
MRRAIFLLMFSFLLLAIALSPAEAEAEPETKAGLTLGSILPVFVGPVPISPPAVRFDERGSVHLAWLEKSESTGAVKSIRIGNEGKAVATPVQVNPEALPPDAFHLAPGLATGTHDHVFVSWSTTNRTPGSLFASDLKVARSQDGGRTFEAPIQVNDDGLPISHTFEDLATGHGSDLYLAWLDGRGKDQSGAGVLFGCSKNQGQTIGKNLTVDGMACPCCRPMMAVAPNGHLWVAWRKTFAGNVRDIVLAKSEDRGQTFSSPLLVHKDNWVFSACPHRGPSIGFDRFGRMYVGWYTEGADEQPRLFVATSDDQGQTFSSPISLHTSTTSLPDQMRMAVHPDGAVVAVWEEITGVRKRVVMRVSMDRGQHFGPLQPLSAGAKAEYPTVAIHESGSVAISWTEQAWPNNRIVLQQGRLISQR